MKENKEIILNLNALVKKINKNRKRLCSLFVFLIVFVGLLITTQEDVYAGIATYLPRTAGFCKIRVFVDGTYRSSYTLNCKLLTDMKSEEEMADLKWTFGGRYWADGICWVENTLIKTDGDDILQTCGRAYTYSDGVPGYAFNTRQYLWTFPFKASLTGYHLEKVVLAENGVQAVAAGFDDGRFFIVSDTNGLGITNWYDGTGNFS